MMLVDKKKLLPGSLMATLSASELLDWLGQHQFLSSAQLDEIRPLLPTFPDTHSLAKDLIRRDWLTPYQVNQILQGNHDQLVLGNYRLRERLGEGAMGAVFKAWNPRMRRTVALKMLHKQLVSSAKAMDRFRREMKTAGELDHPNIASVRDGDEAEGRPFMVMDYIEGFNLSHRVKQQGPLPIHEAVEYARQTALGLQHAFERGIVHRDIKPGNILVTMRTMNNEQFPLVKILDFGLARYDSENDNSARLTQVGNLLGTVDYVAPEQAQNARTADIRADIYSLGCTLFYMLAGKPPFSGSTVVEKIGPRLIGEPPSIRAVRPEVSAALDELLRKIMARLPTNRFQTPIEVAEALQPFTSKEVVAVPSMELPQSTAAPAPANPAPATPAPVVMAQPVAADAIASGEVPLAQPILAMPVPAAAEGAVTTDPPFLALPVDPDVNAEAEKEVEPAFLSMSSTGLGDLTEPIPKSERVKPKKPLPVKLLVLLGGGAALFFGVLCTGGCLLGYFYFPMPFGDNGGGFGQGNASIKITKAIFSTPDGTVKDGDAKRVIVFIDRVEFNGAVHVSLEDLPDGVRMSKALVIPSNQNQGEVPFMVSHGTQALVAPIRVVASDKAGKIKTEKTLELKVRN